MQAGSREQDGHCVQLEGVERLLRDVVGADVVFEGQVELVVPGHQVKAGVSVNCVRVPQTSVLPATFRAASAINVYLQNYNDRKHENHLDYWDYPNSFGKPTNIPVPSTVRTTMGDKP